MSSATDSCRFVLLISLLRNTYILSLVSKDYPTAFQFVFVDEMQDMEPHQYTILESIFYDNGNSNSNLQRIETLTNRFIMA